MPVCALLVRFVGLVASSLVHTISGAQLAGLEHFDQNTFAAEPELFYQDRSVLYPSASSVTKEKQSPAGISCEDTAETDFHSARGDSSPGCHTICTNDTSVRIPTLPAAGPCAAGVGGFENHEKPATEDDARLSASREVSPESLAANLSELSLTGHVGSAAPGRSGDRGRERECRQADSHPRETSAGEVQVVNPLMRFCHPGIRKHLMRPRSRSSSQFSSSEDTTSHSAEALDSKKDTTRGDDTVHIRPSNGTSNYLRPRNFFVKVNKESVFETGSTTSAEGKSKMAASEPAILAQKTSDDLWTSQEKSLHEAQDASASWDTDSSTPKTAHDAKNAFRADESADELIGLEQIISWSRYWSPVFENEEKFFNSTSIATPRETESSMREVAEECAGAVVSREATDGGTGCEHNDSHPPCAMENDSGATTNSPNVSAHSPAATASSAGVATSDTGLMATEDSDAASMPLWMRQQRDRNRELVLKSPGDKAGFADAWLLEVQKALEEKTRTPVPDWMRRQERNNKRLLGDRSSIRARLQQNGFVAPRSDLGVALFGATGPRGAEFRQSSTYERAMAELLEANEQHLKPSDESSEDEVVPSSATHVEPHNLGNYVSSTTGAMTEKEDTPQELPATMQDAVLSGTFSAAHDDTASVTSSLVVHQPGEPKEATEDESQEERRSVVEDVRRRRLVHAGDHAPAASVPSGSPDSDFSSTFDGRGGRGASPALLRRRLYVPSKTAHVAAHSRGSSRARSKDCTSGPFSGVLHKSSSSLTRKKMQFCARPPSQRKRRTGRSPVALLVPENETLSAHDADAEGSTGGAVVAAAPMGRASSRSNKGRPRSGSTKNRRKRTGIMRYLHSVVSLPNGSGRFFQRVHLPSIAALYDEQPAEQAPSSNSVSATAVNETLHI
ncbi:unnamed protein product [Amoebophrya sp. A120]|nr:unnamed protein product [Amoebophrya sp. A120]|eukprot:GSA120T00002346001.1